MLKLRAPTAINGNLTKNMCIPSILEVKYSVSHVEDAVLQNLASDITKGETSV